MINIICVFLRFSRLLFQLFAFGSLILLCHRKREESVCCEFSVFFLFPVCTEFCVINALQKKKFCSAANWCGKQSWCSLENQHHLQRSLSSLFSDMISICYSNWIKLSIHHVFHLMLFLFDVKWKMPEFPYIFVKLTVKLCVNKM